MMNCKVALAQLNFSLGPKQEEQIWDFPRERLKEMNYGPRMVMAGNFSKHHKNSYCVFKVTFYFIHSSRKLLKLVKKSVYTSVKKFVSSTYTND